MTRAAQSPGKRITILGVEGDSGTAVPRMFKARRKTVAADGYKRICGERHGCSAQRPLPA